MFLSCLAMFFTLLFTGMDGALPWKSLDMKPYNQTKASYDLNRNASVNDTNMMDILSHESDVALSVEYLLENGSVREERISEQRDLQSYLEDVLDYNGTGKSLVLYEKFSG